MKEAFMDQVYNWKIRYDLEEKTGCGCCYEPEVEYIIDFQGTKEQVKDKIVSLTAQYELNHYVRMREAYVAPLDTIEEAELELLSDTRKETFQTKVQELRSTDQFCNEYLTFFEEKAAKEAEKQAKEKAAKEARDKAEFERLKAKFGS